MQMMTIMDNLLKKEGLDLKFTLYRTLASSNNDGVLGFVEGSKTIQSILQTSGMSQFVEKLATETNEDKNRLT